MSTGAEMKNGDIFIASSENETTDNTLGATDPGESDTGDSIDAAENADGVECRQKEFTELHFVYEYDSSGNMVKNINCNSSGKVINWTEGVYDSYGKMIKKIVIYLFLYV